VEAARVASAVDHLCIPQNRRTATSELRQSLQQQTLPVYRVLSSHLNEAEKNISVRTPFTLIVFHFFILTNSSSSIAPLSNLSRTAYLGRHVPRKTGKVCVRSALVSLPDFHKFKLRKDLHPSPESVSIICHNFM